MIICQQYDTEDEKLKLVFEHFLTW